MLRKILSCQVLATGVLILLLATVGPTRALAQLNNGFVAQPNYDSQLLPDDVGDDFAQDLSAAEAEQAKKKQGEVAKELARQKAQTQKLVDRFKPRMKRLYDLEPKMSSNDDDLELHRTAEMILIAAALEEEADQLNDPQNRKNRINGLPFQEPSFAQQVYGEIKPKLNQEFGPELTKEIGKDVDDIARIAKENVDGLLDVYEAYVENEHAPTPWTAANLTMAGIKLRANPEIQALYDRFIGSKPNSKVVAPKPAKQKLAKAPMPTPRPQPAPSVDDYVGRQQAAWKDLANGLFGQDLSPERQKAIFVQLVTKSRPDYYGGVPLIQPQPIWSLTSEDGGEVMLTGDDDTDLDDRGTGNKMLKEAIEQFKKNPGKQLASAPRDSFQPPPLQPLGPRTLHD
ncbi:MAG: hypothetical protein ACR2NM_07385, partial [Bythopirellula sp.]